MSREHSFIFVYITCGNEKEAEKIALQIVKEKLAACANFFPISSIYWWKEKVERAKEYGLIFKTTKRKYLSLKRRVKELHSYELPALVCWEMKGDQEFLNWIKREVSGKDYEGEEKQ